MDDVEVVEYIAQAGADALTVKDLTPTDAIEVVFMNERQPGQGDFFPDTLTVTGTNTADTIAVAGQTNGYMVYGMQTTVRAVGAEAEDELTVNMLGGDDVFNASSSSIGKLTVDGGSGNDSLRGSHGPNDILRGNTGNDTFIWDPGDGSDTLEGQAGRDILRFSGSNAGEAMQIQANGTRTRFLRNIGNVSLDVDTIEDVAVTLRGGNDTMAVNDLVGTAVQKVSLSLEQADGSADLQPDLLSVHGSAANDTVRIDSVGGIRITGLTAAVTITGAEAANDQLTLTAQGGDDRVDASALAAGAVNVLLLHGGEGNDHLIGSPADDALDGGPGHDTLDGRAGVDNALNGEVLINIP
jgi:Ca2+-binding RTX toxin-like protein